ncbi:MAG: DEAD/DEAH box helicase [Gemmatimonadales bacterium]
MAEALVPVDDPLTTVLRLGVTAAPAGVIRAMARAVAPLESVVEPPAWLRPDQIPSFRRCLAAVMRHGGALLADPVGSGKTWIALAVAGRLQGRHTAVAIVPAVLRSQWARTAERAGVALTVVSHESVSRGRLPPDAAVVLIDEAHHFRHPDTCRYRHLAPWLVGRRTLLLTGTPVVNRLEDLVHQLLLAVRDDALRQRGVPSLAAALRTGTVPPALGDLIFRRADPQAQPARRARDLTLPLSAAEATLLTGIDRLDLSRDPGISSLIRVQLWRALASSSAALRAALQQYLTLLQQARSARAAGRRLTRSALLAQLGTAPEQLLLWGVLPDSGGSLDLRLTDAERVKRLVQATARVIDTPRLEALRGLLRDTTPTLVFTTSRPTLALLRDALPGSPSAWISGHSAGIGRTRLPRRAILDWFGPTPPTPPDGLRPPSLLLATDVAAEGLDLQRIGRVIHWDLPWTSVRLDQREGRAIRLGSMVPVIETIRFLPPVELESRLRQSGRIDQKRQLGATAGLVDRDGWLFRWRAELGERFGTGPANAGVVAIEGVPSGWLIALAMDRCDGACAEAAGLFWLGDDGVATDAPDIVVPRLGAAADAPLLLPAPSCAGAIREALCPFIRARLQAADGAAWSSQSRPLVQRQALASLRRLGRQAAADRAADRLRQVERGMIWLGGGLLAGELLLLEVAIARGPDALMELVAEYAPRPEAGRATALIPRLAGVVRVGSFRPCHPSAPCCSTSTAPSSTVSR